MLSNKIRFCCFLDTRLYLSSLSTLAMISSLIMLELFSACSSRSNNSNQSQSSVGSEGKNIVESPQALIAGKLTSFMRDLFLLLFRPFCLLSNFISLPN